MPENKIDFMTILKYNSYFWSIWLLFYSVVFYINIPNMSYFVAIPSSIIITIPLFALSLVVWPVMRWVQYKRLSRFVLLLLHFSLANIFTIFWLGFYYGVLFSIFGNDLYNLFNVKETMVWQYPSGITFYLMVSWAYYSIIYYTEIKSREISESKLQFLLKDAQFTALRNQLNPHFLFNSLNSINALIKSNPEKARSMLVKLSDLLRMSLNHQNNAFVSLQKDLEFAHAYLDIEKIRLEDRFKYKEKVAVNIQKALVPSMIIQPLLENAIKHGITPSSQKGLVELKIDKFKDSLKIYIVNSLNLKQNIDSNLKIAVNGVGLKNLTDRLEMIYNNDFHFASGKTSDNMFMVEIEIPYSNELS